MSIYHILQRKSYNHKLLLLKEKCEYEISNKHKRSSLQIIFIPTIIKEKIYKITSNCILYFCSCIVINDNDNINWCIYNILHASYLLKMYCYLLKINDNKEIIKSSTRRESVNVNINFDEKKIKSNNGTRRGFL